MKTQTTHTPGPWTLVNDGDANFYGIAIKKGWLLRIQQNGELFTEEQQANARLIAAAPELLEALKDWIKLLPDLKIESALRMVAAETIEKSKNAIAKATKGE